MREETEPMRNDCLDDALRGLYSAPVPDSFQNNWMNAVRREEIVQMNQSMEKKQKRNPWLKRALPVAAALVLVVGGIWAGGLDLQGGASVAPAGMSAQTAPVASRASKSSALNGAANTADSAMPERMMANEASYDAASYSSTATGGAPSASMADGGAAFAQNESRKLVRTADLSIRTGAFEQDLQAIQALLASLGGYVENISQSGDQQSGATRSANMSLRVPSDKLDEFLSGASGVGRVVSRNETSADMTVQYADNEARLNTLRQKLTRLNELLAKAESVDDLIQIESAIADTQYMIDSYETSQRSIDRRVDMSEVYISLREDDPTEPSSDMSMGERLSAALSASLEGLGRFFKNVLVFLTMALPVLVPVAVIALLLWLRAKRRKGKENK